MTQDNLLDEQVLYCAFLYKLPQTRNKCFYSKKNKEVGGLVIGLVSIFSGYLKLEKLTHKFSHLSHKRDQNFVDKLMDKHILLRCFHSIHIESPNHIEQCHILSRFQLLVLCSGKQPKRSSERPSTGSSTGGKTF